MKSRLDRQPIVFIFLATFINYFDCGGKPDL